MGHPAASAWRPPSAWCATTAPTPRRRRSSTTSTSSSSRRSTPTAPTYSIYDFAAAHATWSTTARRHPVPEQPTTRRTATAGASTSTATSRSARSSTASRARRHGLHRRHFAGPFELSEPETRNEICVQNTFRTSSSRSTSTPPAATSCGPRAPTSPDARRRCRTRRYGTLNFFDQTARTSWTRIKDYRGTAILPQQTGPVHRRPLLRRRQLRGRGVLQPRHHRLRLRDRRHEVLATARPRHRLPAVLQPGRQPRGGTGTCNASLVNEGHDEGMEFANGNYALLQSALDYAERHDARRSSRHRRHARRQRHLRREVHVATRRPRSTTRPTARRRPRPPPSGSRTGRASCRCRSDSRADDDAQVDRDGLQGQHLRGQSRRCSARPTRPARSAAPSRRRWR